MRLGFVFDTRYTKYKNDYYSSALSKQILEERYLSFCDSMTIIGRYKNVEENPTGRLNKINCDNITFKCYSNGKSFKRVLNFKKDSKYIESVLKECDAVICRGWRGTRICRKLGKPYLIELVNCPWDCYWNYNLIGKLVAPLVYLIARISVYNAPNVIYVTNEFLQKRYPTKGNNVSISNVALNMFDENILFDRVKRIESSNKSQKLVIGTAAAVDVPFKGQRFVIKALSILRKQGIDRFEYHIAGSGDISKLKKLAIDKGVEDLVVFEGNIARDKIYNWFDSIDIYIQPSLQEGLPRALIEAMSRGLPCFGTKTGGIPELLDNTCVCTSNYFIAKKIAKFLKGYNKDFAIEQANRNFEEAQKYEAKILENRRYKFLKSFFIQIKNNE